MTKLFQRGNRKLPREIAIFNLPHLITCPGATAECRKYCYARKAETMYPQSLPYRYRNWEASKRLDFVGLAVVELLKMRKVKAVRIHESGDFYNQEYLNKWVEIAKNCPHLIFTAYTKSLHLDFSAFKALPNTVLFASVDPTTPAFMLERNHIRSKARVIKKNEKVPTGYFPCPGSCKNCSHCYTIGAKSVAFHKH